MKIFKMLTNFLDRAQILGYKSPIMRYIMKKMSIAPLLLFFVFACSQKVSLGTALPSVVFYQSIGDVKIFDAKNVAYAPKIKDLLKDGDKIKTGTNGQVELFISTGGLIRVLKNSEVILNTKFFADKDQTQSRFYLNSGKVFIKQPVALKKGESLEVVTPTQIGGVRGTEFMAVVNEESSKILVSEGKVQTEWISDPTKDPVLTDSSEVVNEGNKSEADNSKRETAPLGEDEKQLLAEQGKSAAQLILEAKEQMDSIRESFETERNRIRMDLENFKGENKQIINDQKANNQDTLEGQKQSNRNLMDAAKGDSEKGTREMQNAKESQKGDIKNSAKSELDAIKQGMKK